MTAIAFPAGTDGRKLLAPLNSAAWEHSAEYRRAVTRTSPLLFAITYFPQHLSSAQTKGAMSFSRLHLDIAAGARRWVRNEPLREAWIAPRGAAKSTWLFLILPLWALAHGHRRHFLAFAHSGPQATQHMANLRMELDTNDLLCHDFPDLAPLARVRGARDNGSTVTLKSGAMIAARGADATSLGLKSGSGDRPDLIVLDDLEPDESNYSTAAKGKRLATLTQTILPMNEQAVVQLAGTVTMHGSITHDLVRAALGESTEPWIAEERFVPRYYPAIVTDPDTGAERSLWPQRWSLSYLQSIRHTRSYALNFDNRPGSSAEGGSYWSRDLFRYDPPFVPVRYVMSLDVAVTSGEKSDMYAIAIVGIDISGRRAVVEHVWAGRVSPAAFKQRVHRLLANPRNRSLLAVVLEANNGGDTWREILEPMPRGVTLDLFRVHARKQTRLKAALARYEDGAVWHARPFRELEDQACAYPDVAHDDLLDAVAAGLRYVFTGSAKG